MITEECRLSKKGLYIGIDTMQILADIARGKAVVFFAYSFRYGCCILLILIYFLNKLLHSIFKLFSKKCLKNCILVSEYVPFSQILPVYPGTQIQTYDDSSSVLSTNRFTISSSPSTHFAPC